MLHLGVPYDDRSGRRRAILGVENVHRADKSRVRAGLHPLIIKVDFIDCLPRYVLWDRLELPKNHSSTSHAASKDPILPPPVRNDDDDAAEGRPCKDAVESVSDLTRSVEEPPVKRQKKGQNKGRQFARIYETGQKLCVQTARGEPCPRLAANLTCDANHDILAYLNEQKNGLIEPNESQPYVLPSCPVSTTASSHTGALLTCVRALLSSTIDSVSVHTASNVASMQVM